MAASRRPHQFGAASTAPIFLFVFLIVVWGIFTHIGTVEPWRMPSPCAVAMRGASLFSHGWMWTHIGITASESLLGCILGAAIALPMSYLIFRFRLFRLAVEPFLGATQAIPAIALAPLLVLWVGYGLVSIVLLCALLVFFPILVSAVLGLRHIDQNVLEAAQLDGASGWVMLRRIQVPLAAPAILAGLRNGFTLSVTGSVIGEMVMGGKGLGQTLVQQRNNHDTPGMFVTIFILCFLAMTAYACIYKMEKKWRRSNAFED